MGSTVRQGGVGREGGTRMMMVSVRVGLGDGDCGGRVVATWCCLRWLVGEGEGQEREGSWLGVRIPYACHAWV